MIVLTLFLLILLAAGYARYRSALEEAAAAQRELAEYKKAIVAYVKDKGR